MKDESHSRTSGTAASAAADAPEIEVVIEVPRGSFLKRGNTGRVDFVSPLPEYLAHRGQPVALITPSLT